MALLWVLLCSALTVRAVSSQGIVFPGTDSSSSDECVITSGSSPGVCRPLTDCPPIQLSVASGGRPSVCGYSGGQLVVCCPKPETNFVFADWNTSSPITIGPVEPPPNLDPCGTRSTIFHNDRGSRFRRARLAVAAAPTFDDDIRAIAGGQDAIRQSWPWMALLGVRVGDALRWYCDGVLINERWIITAAHCITKQGTPDVVRLGEHDHSSHRDGAQTADYAVDKVALHPLYQAESSLHGYHDLALIRLKKNVIYKTGTFPVCLPWGEKGLRNLVDVPASITGWGAKEFGGNSSPILQEAKVDVFESSTCDSQYKVLPTYTTRWPQGITSDTFLCAGKPQGGVDSCQGDSGGPLVYESIKPIRRWMLGGVVSQGYGCGLKEFAGLYVPVGNPAYLQWIKETAFL